MDERASAAGAEIRSAAGYRYRLTVEDLLWLARATQYEGGDHASTIWSYAQRAALYRVSSFTQLVRGHSQPVNPAWDERTDRKCIDNPARCTEEELARRQEAATLPWTQIRPSVRAKVMAWARAELPNPVPRAVDFANEPVSRNFISRHPDTVVIKRAGNWYLAYGPSYAGGTLQWPANFVTMTYQGRTMGQASTMPGWARGALWGAAAAVLAGASWWVWRAWR